MAEAMISVQPSTTSLLEFSRFLSERVGLHFPAARLADLGQRVAALSHRMGWSDVESCMRWLMSDPLEQGKVEAIAAHLTVGETYFFREPDTFDAIEQQVLPELIRSRQAVRRLRIWSAGCSTGEEAYTLAILVDRLGAALQGWQVTILATDIHAKSLQWAGEAHYRDWSFRNVDAGVLGAYFRPTPDGRHALIARVRERVQFQHLNLADTAYPCSLNHTSGMDLILCRNVLMYFAPEVANRVVARLGQTLADNGCLVTGASETWMPRHGELLPVTCGSATVFRRSLASSGVAVSSRLERRASSDAQPDLLARARALADTGRLDESLRMCAQAVAADKLDPSAHYLHGLVLMEAGKPVQAEQGLRTTIYLEPDFVMAHVALAGGLLARGRAAETRRHLGIARRLLRGRDPQQTIAGAEGKSCAQVLRMLDGMREQAHA